MLSSTIACARPRLFLRTAPALERYRGLPDARSLAGRFCSPAGLQRRPWLARLRRACREQLFTVHYQPIVSLADGRVSHHEALVRLADEPDGRLLAPARFLPAAERYGLVREIDRIVLEKTIALLARERSSQHGATDARACGQVRIAVNLSALSVTDEGMLAFISARLRAAGVEPSSLVIEITETASICDMGRAAAFCAGLSALGCDVALDDFGTGFGSLSYLTRLPFRYLKIDGEFIRALPDSRNDQLVVRALVALVREMGGETVAEFVHERRMITLLKEFGVDHAQGFALGRPRAALHASAPMGVEQTAL